MKRSELALFILIIGAFLFFTSFFRGFLQDDAYIFARYAQNIADGNGFVFNKGEYTEGATSLLWTLFGALAALFKINLPAFYKTISLISSILWIGSFFLVCRQWLKGSFQWTIPVVLFVCFPNFLLWSQAGLEITFFGFLVTIGFYLAEEWHSSGNRRYFLGICLTSVLLILTRPEALPVIFLYCIYLVLSAKHGRRHVFLTQYFPITAITFLGLLLFRYVYFGDLVPNTFYAKGGGGYFLRYLGVVKFSTFLGSTFNFLFFGLVFPVFFINSRIRIILLMVPMWTLYYIHSGGDILPEHRLLLPAAPFMLLGTFYFFSFIKSAYFTTHRSRIVFGISMMLIASISIVKYYQYYNENLSSYTEVISALERAHGKVGRYLDAHMKPTDSAILTDAGMTSLYAQDKHMVDWLGLCDKRVAKIFYETGYNEWAMAYCYDNVERNRRKNACYAAMNMYFNELQPTYAVLNLYLKTNSEDMMEMVKYYKSAPDTLNDFVISKISFEGYFGVFTHENNARGYKPLLITPFNPYFWVILVERDDKKQKNPSNEGF